MSEYRPEPERRPNPDRAAAQRAEYVRRWRRRRRRTQTKISVISVLVMAVVFFSIALFLLVFPRSKVSQIEQRELTKFPEFSLSSYFAGDYTAQIAECYDDTVPYRDTFKTIGNKIDGWMGLRTESGATFVNGPAVVNPQAGKDKDSQSKEPDEENDTPAARPSDPEAPPAAETGPDAEEPEEQEPPAHDYTGEEAEGNYENGLLIVSQDGHWRCMGLFGGGSGKTYISALNDLQQQVGSDVRIYSMPAPLASEFYVPSNFAEYSSSQSDCFDEIAAQLDSRITSVNVCSAMAKHAEEEIYLRTDHHWQPLGAFYAAQEFANAAGVPFAPLSSYTKGVNKGFVGTMYAFSGDSRIQSDPEDFTYYEPTANIETHYYSQSFDYRYSGNLFQEVDTANSYLMFMGGDNSIVKIDTSTKNGRKLLIVKDSYGNAEVPFYTSSFEQVVVVDMRYFERNLVNFIKTLGITDVLFTMSSYSVVGTNADNLPNLLTQDAAGTIVDGHPTSTVSAPAETAPAANGGASADTP